MPILTTIIQQSNESLARTEKEIKGIHIEKEEVKWSLFTHDIVLYIEYPKYSAKSPPPNPVKTNKQFQQRCRTQNQHAKLSGISIDE